MARQEIILGTAPTGLGGDPPRTASTKINAMTLELYDTTPISRGGTGGNTLASARASLGLKTAALADILGGVSQTGGVPTGAIFQTNTSANGNFVLFADGSGIAYSLNLTFVATANTDISITWQFPAVFSAAPYATATIRGPASSNTFNINKLTVAPSSGSSAVITGNFSVGQTYYVSAIAIGRWF